MSREQQIADAWMAAFNRPVAVMHDHPDTEDEIFVVEGVVIATDPKGWFVGAEVVVPATWSHDADYQLLSDSVHPTFEEALVRAVALMREDEERRLREMECVVDDATPF
jgi:hypothetical protein